MLSISRSCLALELESEIEWSMAMESQGIWMFPGVTDFLCTPFDGLGGFVALSAGYNGYRCRHETQPSRPLDWVGVFF